jgi:hypothetical protein
MRIVEVHEKTVSIASPISNANIDFSKMTCSVPTSSSHSAASRTGSPSRMGGCGCPTDDAH